MKQITVRLDDEVHRAVKIRAASEGVAMETLARQWFEDYAERADGDVRLQGVSIRRLAAGAAGVAAPPGAEGTSTPAKEPPAPAASTRHVQPDFKRRR